MLRRILTYLLSSGISVLVDFSVFTAASYAGAGVFAATAIGRACSCIVNFTLNRKTVFRSDGNIYVQFVKYILLVIFSGTLSATAISFLQKHLPIHVVITKAFVESILFFVNYVIQRKLIFKSSQDAPAKQETGADAAN